MSNKKPCIRCLVRELGEQELLERIRVYQDSIPSEEQAAEEIYQHRLAQCGKCSWLNKGICGRCGCFVEARAYRKKAFCPHEHPRW